MSNEKKWAHDLAAGIAAASGWLDAPNVVDERLLAQTLRKVASECDDLGHMLLLRSVADALDHPKAEKRLRLGKAKAGRPETGQRLKRALMVGPSVSKQVLAGVKKEAAVQEAMTRFGLSRSAVVRSTSEYEQYRKIFDPSLRGSPRLRAMHDIVIEADEEKGRLIERNEDPFDKERDL